MKLSLKIAIVEPSVMVRTGLGTLLRKLSGMQITVVEILKVESLHLNLIIFTLLKYILLMLAMV